MTPRENMLRAIRFENPEHIPVRFHINSACWHHYPPEALIEMMAEHPVLYPDFDADNFTVPEISDRARAGHRHTGIWGCVWETSDDGIAPVVVEEPLADWAAFEGWQPPDPDHSDGRGEIDWAAWGERLAEQHAAGLLAGGGLPHGHTFLLLTYLRGYENVICDMADNEPRLHELIKIIEDYNYRCIEHQLEYEPDIMQYPEDLGMQVGPMLSPAHFRKYIKPVYQRLMAPARERGIPVHMHSDGDIRALAADLVDGGVEVLNLQDLVNGIDWIAENYAGKICIDLDIDRQQVTRFGTPADIDELIREEVERLSSPKGGLMMLHGVYPGIPLENIRATMDAMERYATFHD